MLKSLSVRVKKLEPKIKCGGAKLIFIMPYADPREPISGLTATLQGRSYTFIGDNLDELVQDAQSLLEPKVLAPTVELVSVSISDL